MFEATGTIRRLFAVRDDWCAGLLDTDHHETISFAGKISLKEGDVVTLRGKWKDSPRFGLQLNVDGFAYETPSGGDGLMRFLEKSAAFEGIGASRARAIVEAAGDDFEGALKNPEALATRARVPIHVVQALRDEWFSNRDKNVCMARLAEFGITPGRASKLFAAHGASVITIIERNPYWLIGEVPGMGFLTIDKFALGAGHAKTHPGRIRACLMHELSQQESDGHTWTDQGTLRANVMVQLTLDDIDGDELILNTLYALAEERAVTTCATPDGSWVVWRTWLFQSDHAVYQTILDHGKGLVDYGGWASVETAKRIEERLNAGQLAACATSWAHRLSVITGGAGVGKTFVVDALKRGFESKDKTVALCAPTGKAAKRLGEAVGGRATTIHRLLGVDRSSDDARFKFLHHATNKLLVDIVIVDEVSMVDTLLFGALFDAIDLTRTQVVLVGDHHQLPPVGPGSLLRDVIDGGFCPVSHLTEIVRQDHTLKECVTNILKGSVRDTIMECGPAGTDAGPWLVFDKCESQQVVQDCIAELFLALSDQTVEDKNAPNGRRPIDPVWDVLYLSPMYKYEAGVDALNVRLQRLAHEQRGETPPLPPPAGKRATIVPKDKVIYTRNNYDLDLMNGTIGEVVMVMKKGETIESASDEGPVVHRAKSDCIAVEFEEPSGVVLKLLDAEAQKDLQLAYAMTIHKAQGSESPVTVVVCQKSNVRMLHRNLFYTAVSRARKCCVIVGDRWSIRTAANNVISDRRRTIFSLIKSGAVV